MGVTEDANNVIFRRGGVMLLCRRDAQTVVSLDIPYMSYLRRQHHGNDERGPWRMSRTSPRTDTRSRLQ